MRLEININESSNFVIISDVSLSTISPLFLKFAYLNVTLFHSVIIDFSFASISFSFVAAMQTSLKQRFKLKKLSFIEFFF